tara:strand:+ start:1989 stop:2948 length:960 start_codon:yes stop_codon:yes gene_type:complete
MTTIEKLILNVKKKCDYNIFNSIIVEKIDSNNIKLLINNFYQECAETRFSNNGIILNYISNCTKCIKLYSNISNITIYLYYKKNNNSILKLTKIYRRLIIICQIYNINKKLTYHLALCKFKRYMPNKNDIFNCINFNGGFTNIRGNDIYIYRNCEYSKVILHELFHHINIINDTTMYIDNNDMYMIKKKFNISHKTIFLPNEANIEFWATLYNLIFISCEYNINFNILYKKELEFSYNQVLKILNHNNKNLWYEETNVYCYFILKYILLKNYDKFLKLDLPYDSKKFINFFVKNYKDISNTNKKYNKNKSLNTMVFSSF